MGMSTHVALLRDRNDPEHQKKVAVLRSCVAAKIAPPEEIQEYFEDTCDEDLPLEVDFKPRRWRDQDGMREGFEVDLSELPPGVKTIRFYNSY